MAFLGSTFFEPYNLWVWTLQRKNPNAFFLYCWQRTKVANYREWWFSKLLPDKPESGNFFNRIFDHPEVGKVHDFRKIEKVLENGPRPYTRDFEKQKGGLFLKKQKGYDVPMVFFCCKPPLCFSKSQVYGRGPFSSTIRFSENRALCPLPDGRKFYWKIFQIPVCLEGEFYWKMLLENYIHSL